VWRLRGLFPGEICGPVSACALASVQGFYLGLEKVDNSRQLSHETWCQVAVLEHDPATVLPSLGYESSGSGRLSLTK